jgi:type I restriction enzyme, S subunit
MRDAAPDGWSKVEFDNFTTLQRGKDLTKAEFRKGTVPVAGSNGVIGYHDTAIGKAPGITVGRSGSAGKVTIYEEDFWPHNTSLYVRDFHGNDPYFAGFLLGSLNLARFKTGASVPTLDRNSFKTLPLLVPPLAEQKKIAHILSTVQRAIEAQARIIQITTELKKALMHKLFTEGLRNEPQKQTEIGPIPESWELVALETTGDVVYGIQAAVANNIAAIGTPILTNKNITLDGGFDLEKLNYFVLTSKRHTATILQKGDILFNWRSGSKYHVGKTAYFDLEGEWVHSSFILRIRPAEKINGRYLFHYFNHLREAEFFVKLQTYAINAKFNASAVNALPTAVPNREEQNEIAAVLDAAQKKIGNAEQKHRALQDLFRTLLHQLMTAKTRVQELEITV